MKYIKYFEKIINIDYYNKNLITLKDLNIPKHIIGSFSCRKNELTSLKGCPETVGTHFDCSNNKLTSLEFCPENINGKFICWSNKLTSLKFCPKHIEDKFDCSHNFLTSLEFCPAVVFEFDCSNNNLTSLDFFPEVTSNIVDCRNNHWINPIPHKIFSKYKMWAASTYTEEQIENFTSHKFQKQFLTEFPEKYKDLEYIGYAEGIKEEFDWLFNAIDMGLM